MSALFFINYTDMAGMEYAIGKMADTGANIFASEVLAQRSYDRNIRMLKEGPRAQMMGYKQAGINPFAAQSDVASMPNVTTPVASVGGGSLAEYMNAATQAQLAESQIKRNEEQNEETKANVKLLEERVGLTHAEAVNANAQLRVINNQADQLAAAAALIREQKVTEGYKQKNLEGSTNVLGEQAINLREDRRRIIAEGKISEYNLSEVLPLTSRMMRADLHLKEAELQRLNKEIAKLGNEVIMGNYQVQEAAVTIADVLRKSMADSAREAQEAEQKRYTQATSYGKEGDVTTSDAAYWMRTSIQIIGYIMRDISDALPLGRVLGIDKIGNGKPE